MSIFSWFNSKKPANTASSPESSGLGHVDETVPLMPSDKHPRKPSSPPVSPLAGNRKNERLERRENVYRVVRDSMIRAGVLGSSYKFKVLSLDVRGLQFLVMMDLADQLAGDAGRLAEIEAMMAQTAKMRHDILITGVYWRMSEQVTAGLSRSHPVSAPQPPRPAPEQQAQRPMAARIAQPKQAPRYEPLQADEVAAFKRALASAAPAAPLSASGQIVTSGRRNPAPPAEFEDTQMVDSDERAPPLSSTQYGDLH